MVIRLSNVLGNNKKDNIINDIISQINKNKIILKNIDTTIDFIDIRDVTKVVDECILNNLKGIYNLGSGNGIKTIDLVKKILKINNKNNKEIIQRDNVSRKTFNVLNVNKIKKELNWKPKYDLEQSILNYANKKLKVAVFTGNRAEFGLQLPILREIKKNKKMDYYLVVSGAHLDSDFWEYFKRNKKKGICHS